MLNIPQPVLDRMQVGGAIITAEGVASWPDGLLTDLLAQEIHVPAENGKSVACDACGQDHVEEVVFVESPPESAVRAYIWCPNNGRVPVDLSRLRQWVIDKSKLTRFVPTVARTEEDSPKSVFKRVGENWVIRFGNEHGSFKPIDGLTYIARLLANPGRKFSAEELKRATAVANTPSKASTEVSEEILDGQVGMTKETLQKAADEKTLRECRNRLTEIDVERRAAREAGDIAKLDDLEEEEKKINDYLAKAKNVRGGSRPLVDSQRSMFNAVKQAIGRAMKKFQSGDPPLRQLHDHLSQSLESRNGVFECRPVPLVPSWEL